MKIQTNTNEILTLKEAADFLKMPARTVQYLVTTGHIYYSRTGKRNVRFTRSRLLEWLRDQEGVECRYNIERS